MASAGKPDSCDGNGKRLYIVTYGCQMNERDSEVITSLMMDEGYIPASSADRADLIIFNTCSVRKHAEDRVWGSLGQLRRLKYRDTTHIANKSSTGATPIIGLVGCMGKVYGKKVFERLPHIDFVCGPADIYNIPRLVEEVKNGKRYIVAVNKEKRPLQKNRSSFRTERGGAFVNISEGCSNFCSYCIVPYVRGKEANRNTQDIIDEIKGLVDDGTVEVTLLGQNVNSYKDGKIDFVKLLEMINDINGLRRMRFVTSHPKDAGPALFKAMRDLPKVCEHLHLPLQSGSDRILQLMNRGYTTSHYIRLIDSLRKEIPVCAVTTDIIVGFPTESEDDFLKTYMLMKEVGFDSSFIFKYSPRPFTKAVELTDDIPREIKEERNQILLELQDTIRAEKDKRLIGMTQEVLSIAYAKRNPTLSREVACEKANFYPHTQENLGLSENEDKMGDRDFSSRKPCSSEDGIGVYIKGRTRANQQVIYKGDKSLIGAIVFVKIKAIRNHTLIGEIV